MSRRREIDPRQEIVDETPHQLGMNDHPTRLVPRLAPSEMFAGVVTVQPESVDRGGTRTGRNERR